METNIFERFESIIYSCYILLPFIISITKYVEFTDFETQIQN